MSKLFLQAEWRKLLMLNYLVDRSLLEPYLPYHTEIDLYKDRCYISLVGFMFLDTKLKGLRIPFHTTFEEVNLRFYVRHYENGAWKRGVVFIKEIVSKPALTFIANTLYKENYETFPMDHSWRTNDHSLFVEYKWKKKAWNSINVKVDRPSTKIDDGSEEEFITEHYWGYTKITDKVTSEYRVEHPRWEVYETTEYSIDVDFRDVYGKDFEFLQSETPKSVFLAEGSEIQVKEAKLI
ncbi:MAG: DUF2071 domain-containing protein [Bacteroidota bacterium]|nr:DUF2071 domain-containing protein [Bacteroidota bacterium]